jgi:tetratricopeptide (TPR) repeat protein
MDYSKQNVAEVLLDVVYVVLGVAAVGACSLVTLLHGSQRSSDPTEKVLAAYRQDAEYADLEILYPLDETLFPPEIAPPTFRWKDRRADADAWLVAFDFQDNAGRMSFPSRAPEWTPSDGEWEIVKRRSLEKPAKVAILGYKQTDPQRILSRATISISTSKDEVGAPLFFREVNLPFLLAVKDPAAHIRWRFGEISSKKPPPIVLQKLPVCGNCHSFSADGSTLAMEVDAGNDKGSYAIVPIKEQIMLGWDKIITWSDYRRADNQKTFGLLCQVSPDGRYVVGTVKDRALVVYRPDLAFSQLFFLIKGIMAIYDRETLRFDALPGADDPRYVQTNGTWSPDGETIVFSRSHDKAYDLPVPPGQDYFLVPEQEAEEFLKGGRKFMYDLYRIPFNHGKGGKAEPIQGASDNGMSNYFPKFSPDGKWIVFCKAKSFMLLQPDSELYIIPAEGGEARRLRCNTGRMNSWHSWSPNGKWLVFSSKAYSIYTQLFLTHIDERGQSTPPVVLANFTEKDRAANIPEFANVTPGAIKQIHPEFLDDTNYVRAGVEFDRQGDCENAIRLYRKALEIDPNNAVALANWGACLLRLGKPQEAMSRLTRALEVKPDLANAHSNLGIALSRQNRIPEAVESFRGALRLDPDLALPHLYLGILLQHFGALKEAEAHLHEAVRLNPHDPVAHYTLGLLFCRQGNPGQGAVYFTDTLKEDSDYIPALVSLALVRATSNDETLRNGRQAVELATRACELSQYKHPEALHALAAAYAEVGRFADAVSTGNLAIRGANAAGDKTLADTIERALQLYHHQKPCRSDSP